MMGDVAKNCLIMDLEGFHIAARKGKPKSFVVREMGWCACLLLDISLLSYGQVSRPLSPRSSYCEIRHGPHSRTTLSSYPRGTGPSSLDEDIEDLRPSVGGVQGWTCGDGDLVQDGDAQCQLGTFGMSEIRHDDPSSHRGKLRSSCRTSTSPLSPSGMLSFHAMVEKDIEITQRL